MIAFRFIASIVLAAVIGVGQQAPDFKLTDQNRKTVSLASARGQKVVLVFYRGYW